MYPINHYRQFRATPTLSRRTTLSDPATKRTMTRSPMNNDRYHAAHHPSHARRNSRVRLPPTI
ncbi:hypothetical protein N431DRAFT_425123, partial [Stipitochalara longipes BDJ]